MRTEKVTIGTATLFKGDCREILPILEPGSIDAIVTDPPYGIDFDTGRSRRSTTHLAGKNPDAGRRKWKKIEGDDKPFDPRFMLDIAPISILWGANNYSQLLPSSRGWLIWDKKVYTTPDDYGDAELAWTNIDMVIRKHNQLWRGLVREGEENAVTKLHPAQKPVALMEWCLSFVPDARVILDPYMGSGTVGVACMRLQKKYVGIEKDEEYFDLTCKRIEEAQRQIHLFPQET